MPHRGRKRKKSRTQNAATGPDSTANTALETTEKIPKSLVFRKGKTVAELAELVTDLRKLMQPYTAIHFQEDARNRKLTLQQYATHLALPLGMTHLLQISQSPNGNNSCSLKIARLPAGPVLHFKIRQFSLNRHIRSKQKRPIAWTPALSSNSPVVVTHQFLDTTTTQQQQQQQQPHLKLLQVTFQNMFPTLNVSQVQLQHCKRVVLFQRELVSSSETDTADTDSSKEEEVRVTMRHYAITTRATGIAAPLRRLARGKIPNLTHVRDIAEYMEQHATSSYSDDDEEEDDGAGSTVVTSASGTTTTSSTSSTSQQQRALKLVELGPRLDLSLMGVTTGLDTTTTDHPWLWHATKTPEELARLSRARQQRSAAVAARRSQQEANVAAKQAKKDAKAQRRKERREEEEEEESGLEGRKLKNEETIDGVSSSSEEEEDDEGESDPE